MGRRIPPILLAAALLAVQLLVAVPLARAATYSAIRPVLEVPATANHAQAIVDAAGRRHIVYERDDVEVGIWYLTDATGTWVSKKIFAYPGYPARMAVDGSGKVYVVTTQSDDHVPGLHLLTNRSGAWKSLRLTTGASHGPADIAVDPAGEIHIVYGSSSLEYLTNRRGFWIAQTLEDDGSYGPRIALGADGRVHIADVRANGIGYLTDANGVAWVRTHVTSVGSMPSIDVHGTVPRIAFARPNDAAGGIYVATKGTTTWSSVKVLTASVGENSAPDLRFDADGTTYVSYLTSAGVAYSSNAAGAWVRMTVGRGTYPMLSANGDGVVDIVFRDVGAMYAYSTRTPTWSIANVRTSTNTIQPALEIAPDGTPRLVYLLTTGDPGLFTGTWNGTGFSLARITTGADHGPSQSIDDAGASHVAFIRGAGLPNPTLWYGTNATGPWVFDEVATSYSFDCTSIGVDPAGDVHIATHRWVEESEGGPIDGSPVLYSGDGEDWVVDEALAPAADHTCPDLAIDGDGDPHLVYDGPNGIVHTERPDATWTTAVFGNDTYFAPRIAIGADGSIAIGYGRTPEAQRGLWVRSNATGTWVLKRIGPTAYPTNGYDLAIESDGSIHAAYSGVIHPPALHHATNESGAWVTQRLWDGYGAWPSIGIDGDGDVQIAFYDNILGRLAHIRE